jgi:nucleoside-diphosphate-sugar epimerase
MILVTGGTGLVGAHLLFELSGKKEKIRALKRKSSNSEIVKKIFGYYTNEPDQTLSLIEWLDGDITDPVFVHEAMDGIHKVYHTAGFVSFDKSDKSKILETNTRGTTHIVDACIEKKIEKLCFVSSTSAIGTAASGEILNEEIFWAGHEKKSIYAISKYKAEMEVWRGINEGLNAVIVNPSIIIGPGDWQRSSSRLFTEVYKGLKFYTEGITGYVDVRDVVKAMILLMEGEFSGERYILSSGNYSYREIISMIAESLGKASPRIYATPFMLRTAYYLDGLRAFLTSGRRKISKDILIASKNRNLFSNEKIRNATAIEFIPVKDSIRDTAEYFLRDVRKI